jgi:hypothetical protein
MRKTCSSSTVGQRESRATTEQGAVDRGAARSKGTGQQSTFSMTIIEVRDEERIPQQVAQLEEVIQQLQQCITDLELRTVPKTPQEIRDLREATARSAVGRMKALSLECKKLSSRSTQTYENLTENPELQTLESQLQEAKETHRYVTGTVEGLVTSRKDEEVS